MINTDDALNKLIGELNATRNGSEMIHVLLAFKQTNAAVESNIKAGLFLYRNYYLKPAMFRKKPAFIDHLRYLEANGYCPTAACQFVAMPISQDRQSCVVVTKINHSIGGHLVPYRGSIKDASKIRIFANELIALLEGASLYNPAVFDGSYDAWFLTPEKHVIFDHWNELIKLTSIDERLAIKNKILKVCGLS